jgi:hypothetical protein
MRRLLVLVVLAAMAAAGCNGSADSTLTVKSKGGESVVLKLDPEVVVVVMATWCPHATEFRDKVKANKTAAGLKGLRMVYVFDDEWPKAKEMLCRDGTSAAAADKLLAARREKVGDSPVVDPDFLGLCGDAEIYYTDPEHKLPGQGYPRIVAADGKLKPAEADSWLKARLKK